MHRTGRTILAVACAIALAACGPIKRSRFGDPMVSAAERAQLASQADVRSNLPAMDYSYRGFYFKSVEKKYAPAEFVAALNRCILFNLRVTADNGGAVQVMRSFGNSDEQITREGAMLCMSAQGWNFYKNMDSGITRVNYLGLRYEALSDFEIKSYEDLNIAQRKWYEKYAPEVLAGR
ncbi:hypothetical protein [Variovorax gossypii]